MCKCMYVCMYSCVSSQTQHGGIFQTCVRSTAVAAVTMTTLQRWRAMMIEKKTETSKWWRVGRFNKLRYITANISFFSSSAKDILHIFFCLLGGKKKSQSEQSLNPGASLPRFMCRRGQSVPPPPFVSLIHDMKGGVFVWVFFCVVVVLTPACVVVGLVSDCAVPLPSAPQSERLCNAPASRR